MRKRIVFSLLLVLGVCGAGALTAIYYIGNITQSLGALLELHRIEYLRQGLVLNIQTVQADLYRVRTPLSEDLDAIVSNADSLDRAANTCMGCHHAPALAVRVREVQLLTDEYKDALSYYITVSANAERTEALKRDAALIGNRLLALTTEMVSSAERKLHEATASALLKIRRARMVLYATLGFAGFLCLATASYLIRFMTRPLTALIEGTRAIQAGKVGYTIAYQDGSEFGELADNFNAMSMALKASYEDVSRHQRAIQESEWKFRTLSEFAHDWEYWLGLDNQLVYISSSCRSVTGYSTEEFVADPELIARIVHPEDRATYDVHMAEGLDAKSAELEYRIVASSGEVKWVSHICGPIYVDGRLLGRFASNRDITDRKRLEEKLAQSQRMESLGLLAGGVAHDFNNLLTVILGYSSLLGASLVSDGKGRHFAEEVMKAAERAQELIKSLLAFSRKQIIQPQVVDLNRIVRDIEKLLGRVLGEDVELRVHCADDALLVYADAHQIEHVVINLATNARDAMPNGGLLELRTWRERPAVRPRGRQDGRYVALTVRDTGIGMEPKIVSHIFEPFFTTKGNGKGTGLGLATAHGIIEQHGGAIDVDSAPGKGSLFTIYLPCVDKLPQRLGASTGGLLTTDSRGTETILVAEDDELVRGFIETLLRNNGYTPIVAVDGQDAIEKYEANRQRIDLVLLDVVMPRKNGKEVYDHLKAADPSLDVVFLTGYARDILTTRGIGQEGLEILQKPLRPETLLERIRSRCRRRHTPGATNGNGAGGAAANRGLAPALPGERAPDGRYAPGAERAAQDAR